MKAHARANRVSLVLRNRKLALIRGARGLVAEEKPAGEGALPNALLIRVAHKSGKAAPVRHANLNFLTVNLRRGKGDWEADAGIEQRVVVRKIVKIAAKYIAINPELACQRIRETHFVVVRAPRPHRNFQNQAAYGIQFR